MQNEQAGGSAPSSPPPADGDGQAYYRPGLIRPAERVFCGCASITQGVQALCVYLMVKGVVAMMTVLTSSMKGYTGCILQVKSHIKILLGYLSIYVVFSLVRLTRLYTLCQDFKDANVKCDDIKSVYVTLCLIEFVTYAYFSFVAWSYMRKLDLQPDLPRFSLDDNPLFAASTRDAGVAYRMPLAQQGADGTAGGVPGAPGPQRITPFSGQAHRLE